MQYLAGKLAPGGLLNPIVISEAALKGTANAATIKNARNTNVSTGIVFLERFMFSFNRWLTMILFTLKVPILRGLHL